MKKKVSLIVMMTFGCITQLNANDDAQMSCDDSNHTMGKIVAPAVVPVTASMDVVTVGTQHFTSRYIDHIRGCSDNDSDNNMTKKQKPMKKKSCSSNSMKSENSTNAMCTTKCKAPKKCKSVCEKQSDNSDVADRQIYRDVLENPACKTSCHRDGHRQQNCRNHTGHKAGVHKDDNQSS